MGSTFHGVIAFAILATMLLVGGVLRNKVSFFRNSLIPASLVGGFLGFLLLTFNLIPGFKSGDFTVLTFHFFTLSFMSLCLTGKSKIKGAGGSIVRGGLWLTLIWTFSLSVQGLLGYGTMAAYNSVTGNNLSLFLGEIVTHGFTQGPGQALTYGSIWEKSFGIEDITQVGLIYASLGFVAAFVVGIPLARKYIREGLNFNKSSDIDDNFLFGFFNKKSRPSSGKLIPHQGNLDSLAYHLTLLGVAYVITYVWLILMQPVVAGVKPFGISLPILFSFNLFFLHGLIVCVIMRIILDKTGLDQFVDDESLKRITSSSVDFMVVGTLMSIKFSVLSSLLVPIMLVTVVTTITTALFCTVLGRLSGELGPERTVTSFGCCCGSTGTGMLLLRIMDPDFNTSVPKELAFFNIAIIFTNIQYLIFLPVLPSLSGAGFMALFGLTILATLVGIMILLKLKFKTEEV